MNSYPVNEESERSKTKLLFLTDCILGLINDIDCVIPPVDPIPVIVGISFLASISVSHNLILLSSILYVK